MSKNAANRRKSRAPKPTPKHEPPVNYDRIARELVQRGLADPIILGSSRSARLDAPATPPLTPRPHQLPPRHSTPRTHHRKEHDHDAKHV